MNEYTASNGVVVRTHGNGAYITGPGVQARLFPESWRAVTEAVRAEEDERLGRWRWPENPNYVVYPYTDDLVRVLNETSPGENAPAFSRSEETTSWMSSLAARAYFDAHPEPKPWHRAKPGEIWSLTVEGVERTYAAILTRGLREPYVRMFPIDDVNAVSPGSSAPVITAGRRIYPEDDS